MERAQNMHGRAGAGGLQVGVEVVELVVEEDAVQVPAVVEKRPYEAEDGHTQAGNLGFGSMLESGGW